MTEQNIEQSAEQASVDGPAAGAFLPGLVSDRDHAQLSRLVTESAWRVDLGEAKTLHELFTADGELVVGQPFKGRDEIRLWGENLDMTNPYPGIRHLVSNMRFVATGTDAEGRDTAEGTTVLTVFLQDANGRTTSTPWVVGEDHDCFVRTDVGWRFTSRSWVQLFGRD
ncbi:MULTISPECIES: nuclear transport factor 2 family protein [unclassified Streptomyces]|uniref:nuclear transport factor 2 family protein n=1 Tax=unclassified Streptomyces TaxID=2593676 RepID=UPI00202FC8FD|nr:nuclear transport factor 2 family protein [Streptomyces sp. G1]MCM1965299.1 nuclear transport factor 2 family protein [Streptomyces sp. G1]